MIGERLPAVYHWSPAERRRLIRKEGLIPYAPPVVSTEFNGKSVTGWPYLCFGLTPSAAWALSGDMGWTTEVEEWDLWQVRLDDDDEVHIQAEFGPYIKEVRVYGAITADRLWHVATRTVPSAEEG